MNAVHILLGIVFAILVTITAHVGFSVFYPEIPFSQHECFEEFNWRIDMDSAEQRACYILNDQLQADLQQQRDERNILAFIVFTGLGVLFVLGSLLYKPPKKSRIGIRVIQLGILLSGFLFLFTGLMRSWISLSSQIQFVALIIYIAIFIFVVLYKIR